MMNYSISIGLLMFTISLTSLITRYKHILSMLLSLEMMILGIFILLTSMMTFKEMENSILMTFICLAVCEGSLGLSMLVLMSRMVGNTFISSSSIL